MNSFGRLFRVHIFGESHGECVGIVIDGCPAGIPLSPLDFTQDLERRRGGKKGTTTRKEDDLPLLKSGVFGGKTTGAPITIIFENKDVNSSSYEKLKDLPRPGHADLVARKKFGGHNDYRGSGHFSGRLTACLVAAGVVAKKIMTKVKINSELIEAGGSVHIDQSVESALSEGDSVGGIVECKIDGLLAGLGEPFFDSIESALSHAVFSIPAVKGIEFGAGFAAARMRGSEMNDDILNLDGKTATNNSGGINGGLSNSNQIVFRVAVKPTSSIRKTKKTVDMKTGRSADISVEGRHDACIALRVPVVLEAVCAIVLADFMLLEQNIGRVADGPK